MGSNDAHDPVPWKDGAPPELEEQFKRSLTSSPCRDGSDDIRWVCPRCHHEQAHNVVRDQIWAGLAGGGRSGEVDLRCECPYGHPDRPPGAVGCGYKIIAVLVEAEE